MPIRCWFDNVQHRNIDDMNNWDMLVRGAHCKLMFIWYCTTPYLWIHINTALNLRYLSMKHRSLDSFVLFLVGLQSILNSKLMYFTYVYISEARSSAKYRNFSKTPDTFYFTQRTTAQGSKFMYLAFDRAISLFK